MKKINPIINILIAITFLVAIGFGAIEMNEQWKFEDPLWSIVLIPAYIFIAFIMVRMLYRSVKKIVNQWRTYKDLEL